MSEILYAPQIDRFRHQLGHLGFNTSNCITYDDETYRLLNLFFIELRKISQIAENGCREIWVRAERGDIEAYGNYDEWYDCGEVENYDDFIKSWLADYPNETKWYHIEAIETEGGHQAVVINERFVFQVTPNQEKGFPHNTSILAKWLLASVKSVIEQLKDGIYLEFVRHNLPVELRTGTILQSDLWEIYPKQRTRFFDGLSDKDIEEVKSFIEKQPQEGYKPFGRIHSVTANDFFDYCAIGYKAMSYEWQGMTSRELYYRYADGRDEGLSEIDATSPCAFSKWLNDKHRGGGHPWEVCRGGNSTHIALQVGNDDKGYFLYLSGSSYGRANETLKFFLALSRVGLPVYLHDSDIFLKRVKGTEKIGVMPQCVIPKYCESAFPDEKIISFMNLPYENTETVASKCVWQDIKEVHLIETEDKENGRK